MTQYWFICGSVVHSMVQMLSSIGSGVGRCVCVQVCVVQCCDSVVHGTVQL